MGQSVSASERSSHSILVVSRRILILMAARQASDAQMLRRKSSSDASRSSAAHVRIEQEVGEPAGRALALHFACYNFCRVHSSIKMTPAQATGTAWKALMLAGCSRRMGLAA